MKKLFILSIIIYLVIPIVCLAEDYNNNSIQVYSYNDADLTIEKDVYLNKALVVGVYTSHLSDNDRLNNDNHLLGVKYNDWLATTFENSQYDRSHFLGYGWHTDKHSVMDFYYRGNFYCGALYGYGDYVPNFEGWSPMALPTLEVGYDRYSLEMTMIPLAGGVFSVVFNIYF